MTESIAKGKVDIHTYTHTHAHTQIHLRVSKARYRKAIQDTARQDYTRLDKTLI